MIEPTRRLLVGGMVIGAGCLVAPAARADADGHAAGYDVAEAADGLKTIPRRAGEPPKFTASLDTAPLKATSGGWAREITSRTLPIAAGMAVAHLFLNPGGAREMHWHNSAEWAYVLGGHCQITAQDSAGETEVVNLAAGDLWYFPRGHPHAIHTLGREPCHAVLVFDDGLYSEHGTFGISDWMSRIDPAVLCRALGVPADALAAVPPGETYIMQGPVIPLDGGQAANEHVLAARRSHRHRLLAAAPWAAVGHSSIHLAGQSEFPVCSTMTGQVVRLEPGAMQSLHWHPHADEIHYLAAGRVKMTLFAPEKRFAAAELAPGDCAFIPANCGHSVENIGSTACELISVINSPMYQENSLAEWLAHAPRHLLANNLGMAENQVPSFPPGRAIVPGA